MTVSRQRVTRLEGQARQETQRFYACFTDNKTFLLNGKAYTDEDTMRADNGIGDGDTMLKVITPLRGIFKV